MFFSDTLQSSTNSDSYRLLFFANGQARFFKNDETVWDKSLFFTQSQILEDDSYQFVIKLNNNSDDIIGGNIKLNEARFTYHPFRYEVENCDYYRNYFVRKE